MRLLKENGANFVVGIEPSLKNFERAKNTGFLVHNCTLDSFTPNQKYDLLVSVAVLGHIGNLYLAFGKMANLVKLGGKIHLVIPAYDYFRRKRDGCKVAFKDINPDEFVVEVTREQGTMVELVRKVEVYIHAAGLVGLTVENCIPMVPTESLMRDSPRHATFKGQPITYLLRLRK